MKILGLELSPASGSSAPSAPSMDALGPLGFVFVSAVGVPGVHARIQELCFDARFVSGVFFSGKP